MPSKETLLICAGTVVDPAGKVNARSNLLICGGRIEAITPETPPADRKIDASDMLVAPGLIDVHVHLREPGGEHKETIGTGTAAAVAGGFTAVACMPNTSPPLDTPEAVRSVVQRARENARCRVFPVGSFSKGREGKELVDFEALTEAGAVAFSDDGDGLADAELMFATFRTLARLGRVAIQHCEDPSLPRGVMHEGVVSSELNLPGASPLAEEAMIVRDLTLAKELDARYHVAHISTARAVELVRDAKARGVRITAEVCPHHLLLTHEACRTRDPVYKVHPPLRTQHDIDACIQGVIDGTIDMLATDHAPHTPQEKQQPFTEAPPGMIGLETSVALFARALIDPGHLDWYQLVALMSAAPAQQIGIPGGKLSVGQPADVTIIDPHAEWTIDVNKFYSKSRNCPFNGQRVRGRVAYTIVDGEVRFAQGEVLS